MGLDCRAIMRSVAEDRSAALTLDSAAPNCSCEACSFSEFGPVQPEEELLRIVIVPQHVKNGKVKAAVLSHAENIGMSCFRRARASDSELRATACELVDVARKNDPKVGIYGVLLMPAKLVKECVDEVGGVPVFCVYDTAMPGRPAHTDVFQRREGADELVAQTRRQDLFGRVKNNFIPVSEFRGGLLMDFRATDAP